MNAPARQYSLSYFAEAEEHWSRMVSGAPDKLKQFRDCLVEGATCVRIAGYDRAQFRRVFTRIAGSNDLVGKLGGPDVLQAKLGAALDHYVDHYVPKRKAASSVTAIESKLLPKATIDAIDFLLVQNDAERLDDFLKGRPQSEKQQIISYVRWKTS